MAKFGTLPDMPEVVFSTLAAIRIAAADSPSAREVARQMGVSAQLVSMFESGRTELSPENLKRYAQAVERPVDDVRKRWLQSAHAYHVGRARDLRERLRKMGGKNITGRPLKALKK